MAGQALKSLIDLDADKEISTTTSLFINENIPSADYFKELVPVNNYMVNQLKLQQNIAGNELKIGRTGYLPTIALFGKQTLYSNGVDKYLMPRTMIGVGFTWNIFDGLNREKKIRQEMCIRDRPSFECKVYHIDLCFSGDCYCRQIRHLLCCLCPYCL